MLISLVNKNLPNYPRACIEGEFVLQWKWKTKDLFSHTIKLKQKTKPKVSNAVHRINNLEISIETPFKFLLKQFNTDIDIKPSSQEYHQWQTIEKKITETNIGSSSFKIIPLKEKTKT